MFGLGCVAFAAWQADRLWTSPIRGTVAFDAGLVVGLAIGLVATACWVVAAFRKPSGGHGPMVHRWAWWMLTTAIVLIVALFATGPRSKYGTAPEPVPTSAFLVGAIAYVVAGFVGSGIVASVMVVRRATEIDS